MTLSIAFGIILAVFLVRSFDAWMRVRAYREASDVLRSGAVDAFYQPSQPQE
jgi:hypothetical protein